MKRLAAALALLLCACAQEEAPAPTFFADENPERLSAWGMFLVSGGDIGLNNGVTPYDLATPLFTDYAQKLRTVWTPDGAPAIYNAEETFDFPVGTVITKTFYYPKASAGWTGAVLAVDSGGGNQTQLSRAAYRLIETRVLVRRQAGWTALPYVWNDDQTDAVLKRTGAIQPLTITLANGDTHDFPYVVPNQNQCAGCHATNATTKAVKPIGPKARHLNKPSSFHTAFNQLDYWRASGLLDGDFSDAANAPRNAVWTDASETLDARARAYLDANCSHCHNPNGAADTSGLNLEPDAAGPALGRCKAPIAAGGGTGGRPYDIVPGDPDASIFVFRMATTDPGAMMPELGRALAHEEGVALIAEWIAAMEGGCS